MNILGVDPGVTTGLCVCRCKLQQGGGRSIHPHCFAQVKLSPELVSELYMFIISEHIELIVMESIVQSGYLSKEKVSQIRAHDRVLCLAERRRITLEEVQPQAVKQITEVPREVQGNHARDAYRVVAAYLRKHGETVGNR